MRSSYRIVLLILGMFPLMSTLAFSVPGLISYKGQLTDASGGPITTSVDVTFTLWDAESGGTQLGSGFSDTDSVTPNADGIYDTLIGDDGGDMIPGTIFGNNSVWLNVNVDGEDLSPRTRLTPVGAALQAGDADTVDGLEGADLEESADITANTNAIATETGRAQAAEQTNATDIATHAGDTDEHHEHSHGTGNTFLGENAGNLTMTGNNNTASGAYALRNNTTGSGNTASGVQALKNNTEGIFNTASGASALYDNTTGDRNTASGYWALFNNTTGNYNTALGQSAGIDITTGNYNTIIGSYAAPSNDNAQNQIVIGYGATGTGNNQIALGNTSINAIKGQVNFTTYSDSRIKRDIRDSELGLEFIKELRTVSYRWKNPADYPPELREERFAEDTGTRPADNDAVHDGLIAQEIRDVLERLGLDWSGWSANTSDGKQGIQYAALTVPLVRAVQELDDSLRQRDEMVASLETELAAQKSRNDIQIDALMKRLTALEQQIAKP